MSNVQPFKAYVLAFCLGALGALANLFPIELAFNISLLIGNVAYILAASYLRPAQNVIVRISLCHAIIFLLGTPLWVCHFRFRSAVYLLVKNQRLVCYCRRLGLLANHRYAANGNIYMDKSRVSTKLYSF